MKGILKLENGKEIAVDIDEKSLEACIVKPEYKRWRAEVGGKYFYNNICGDTWIDSENSHPMDEDRYFRGNYYRTKEEGEAADKSNVTLQKIKDRIAELNEGWKPDWKDEYEKKWYIWFDRENKRFCVDVCCQSQTSHNDYILESIEVAEKIISEFGDDLKVLFE
jgi:hypothetical protein